MGGGWVAACSILYYIPNTVSKYLLAAATPSGYGMRRLPQDSAAMKKSPPQWNEHQPIYRQLMERLIARILDGTYLEGEMVPSVRQLASDCEVNPLTAAKAYKELARDGLIERVRGEGLIVGKGARNALLKRERSRFLKGEWPSLRDRLRRLGIDVRTLADLAEEK